MPLFRKKETLKDFQYMQDKALKEPLYSVAKLNQPNYNFNNNTFYRKITWNVELRMPNIHTNQLYLFDNSDGNPFLFTLERMSMISTVCFIHKKNKKKRCAKLWIKDLTKAYKSIWEINEAVPIFHHSYDIVKMRLDLVDVVSSGLSNLNRDRSAVLRAEYPPSYKSQPTPPPKYSSPPPMYRLTPPGNVGLDEDNLPAISRHSTIADEGANEGGGKKKRHKTKKNNRKSNRKATRRR